MAQGSSPPSWLHAGADPEDDDELLKHLGPCAKPYLALQDCLISSNRNWIACQQEVKMLKACHDARNSSDNKKAAI